jgi:hypothetical protein
MRGPATSCNICGIAKKEADHWLVAISRPGFEGILFQAAEACKEPLNPLFVYEDLCGHGCSFRRISRYIYSLNHPATSTEDSATEESRTP